jgi:hypothetical protein
VGNKSNTQTHTRVSSSSFWSPLPYRQLNFSVNGSQTVRRETMKWTVVIQLICHRHIMVSSVLTREQQHIEIFCAIMTNINVTKKYNRENWKSKFEMCSNSRLVNNTTNDSNCVYILKGGKINLKIACLLS